MKLSYISLLLLCGSMGFTLQNDINIRVDSKSTKLPDWQWSSGDIDPRTTAEKEAFNITFNESKYKTGDSARITFNSFKVALTSLNTGTTFSQWGGWISLVMKQDNEWVSVVSDTNNRLNQVFYGVDNHAMDSATNPSVKVIVPASHFITMSVYHREIYMNMAEGSPIWAPGKGHGTLTVTIKGVEVKKL